MLLFFHHHVLLGQLGGSIFFDLVCICGYHACCEGELQSVVQWKRLKLWDLGHGDPIGVGKTTLYKN